MLSLTVLSQITNAGFGRAMSLNIACWKCSKIRRMCRLKYRPNLLKMFEKTKIVLTKVQISQRHLTASTMNYLRQNWMLRLSFFSIASSAWQFVKSKRKNNNWNNWQHLGESCIWRSTKFNIKTTIIQYIFMGTIFQHKWCKMFHARMNRVVVNDDSNFLSCQWNFISNLISNFWTNCLKIAESIRVFFWD